LLHGMSPELADIVSASGSLANFASRTIPPVSSTMQTLVSFDYPI